MKSPLAMTSQASATFLSFEGAIALYIFVIIVD